MQQFEHEEERRYSEKEQARIIELAARMQKDEAQTLSKNELELIAAEAGIDPKFVRKAAATLEKPEKPRRVEPDGVGSSFTLFLLILANIYSVGVIANSQPGNLWLALVLAFLAGSKNVAGRRVRATALFVSVSSFAAILCWRALMNRLGMGPVVMDHWYDIAAFAGVQLVVMILGMAVGSISKSRGHGRIEVAERPEGA